MGWYGDIHYNNGKEHGNYYILFRVGGSESPKSPHRL